MFYFRTILHDLHKASDLHKGCHLVEAFYLVKAFHLVKAFYLACQYCGWILSNIFQALLLLWNSDSTWNQTVNKDTTFQPQPNCHAGINGGTLQNNS